MFSGLSWLKPATYAIAFIAGVGAMYLYHDAAISNINESVARERQEAAEQSRLDAWVLQKRTTAIDEKYTKELSDAQEISRQLYADLAAGRKRLSVRANCPGLPETSSSSLGNGGIAILDRISEQAYSDHRALIEKKDAQIKALQSVIAQLK